jgi:adenylate kinase family enzyme
MSGLRKKGIVFCRLIHLKGIFISQVFFLIGASGSGKTTALKTVEKMKLPHIHARYFDSIGVPSVKEMLKRYKTGEEWQRVKTIEWVYRIKKEKRPDEKIILDGQTRPSFIEEACGENGIDDYEIILFDCSDDARKKRLIERSQPELMTPDIRKWAEFLRQQCRARGCTIIDTSKLSKTGCVKALKRLIME